jgi:hypothetical protein
VAVVARSTAVVLLEQADWAAAVQARIILVRWEELPIPAVAVVGQIPHPLAALVDQVLLSLGTWAQLNEQLVVW